MQNPNALHSLFIWKYNTRSGLWDMQRDVSPETRERWLNIFKKDEPNADFLVAKHRPKNAPVKSEGTMKRLIEAIENANEGVIVYRVMNKETKQLMATYSNATNKNAQRDANKRAKTLNGIYGDKTFIVDADG